MPWFLLTVIDNTRDDQITGCTSRRLNFVRWRLLSVAPQYGTCFILPCWRLEHWGDSKILCEIRGTHDNTILAHSTFNFVPIHAASQTDNLPLGQSHTPPFARHAVSCGCVWYFQSSSDPTALIAKAGTWVAVGSSGPASNNNTVQSGFSPRRDATTEPATPAPTTRKSYSAVSIPWKKWFWMFKFSVYICDVDVTEASVVCFRSRY